MIIKESQNEFGERILIASIGVPLDVMGELSRDDIKKVFIDSWRGVLDEYFDNQVNGKESPVGILGKWEKGDG